jgi:ATP-dependent RNA helicase DeaD
MVTPRSASPPTSPRAASTCPISASSSTPTCRPTRRRCCTVRAARAAPARRASSVLLVTHAKRRRTEQVLAVGQHRSDMERTAHREEIREQDRQRLLEHPALEAVVSERRSAVAKQLAERFPAEKLAGALIGLLRSELPEPEDVSDDGRMRNAQTFREPRERALPRVARGARLCDSEGDGVWFRLNVGRERNADPKWILPLICRVGHITKARSARSASSGPRPSSKSSATPPAFAIAVQDTQDDKIQIEPTSAPGPNENIHPGPRPPRRWRPRRPRPPREA